MLSLRMTGLCTCYNLTDWYAAERWWYWWYVASTRCLPFITTWIRSLTHMWKICERHTDEPLMAFCHRAKRVSRFTSCPHSFTVHGARWLSHIACVVRERRSCSICQASLKCSLSVSLSVVGYLDSGLFSVSGGLSQPRQMNEHWTWWANTVGSQVFDRMGDHKLLMTMCVVKGHHRPHNNIYIRHSNCDLWRIDFVVATWITSALECSMRGQIWNTCYRGWADFVVGNGYHHSILGMGFVFISAMMDCYYPYDSLCTQAPIM